MTAEENCDGRVVERSIVIEFEGDRVTVTRLTGGSVIDGVTRIECIPHGGGPGQSRRGIDFLSAKMPAVIRALAQVHDMRIVREG